MSAEVANSDFKVGREESADRVHSVGDYLLVGCTAISLIVGYVNSQGELGFLASREIKASAASLLALVLVIRVFEQPLGGSEIRNSRPLLILVTGFFLLLVATSFQNDADLTSWLQLAQAVGQTAALYYLAVREPNLAVMAVVLSAVGHCALALIAGTQEESNFFTDRASGGSHPILIGISAMTLLALASRICGPRITIALWCLGLYALYASFSRTAIAAFLIGAILFLVVRPGITHTVRIAAVATVAIIWGQQLIARVIEFLAQGQLDSFYGGTGRLEIWRGLWAARGVYLPFGIGLGDSTSTSPSWELVQQATDGVSAENSFLQMLVYAGYPGAIVLLVLLLTMTVAIFRGYGLGLTTVMLSTIMWFSAVTTSGLAGIGYTFVIVTTLIVVGFRRADTRATTSASTS